MAEETPKFSPGPWHGRAVGDQFFVVTVHGRSQELARIHPLGGKPSNIEEWRANAALIIAAPDLYEALEWAVEEIATPEQRASEWGHMARGVLARARGGG